MLNKILVGFFAFVVGIGIFILMINSYTKRYNNDYLTWKIVNSAQLADSSASPQTFADEYGNVDESHFLIGKGIKRFQLINVGCENILDPLYLFTPYTQPNEVKCPGEKILICNIKGGVIKSGVFSIVLRVNGVKIEEKFSFHKKKD